jgi:glycosyltransferase involved in cell wall biosynthesis
LNKVLIISYFFPPCNLTASSRIAGWEKHLPKFGIYPIIVTRNWNGSELTAEERLKDSGSELRIEKKDHSEVHYLPYRAPLRDRFFRKSRNNSVYRIISKMLTLVGVFVQPLCIRAIPYSNLYFHAKSILKENPDVNKVLISGNPFEQFYFGYKLKKAFPEISWIADYRDDWTTSEVVQVPFRAFHRHFEKKWVGTASCFTTISPYYRAKISNLVKIPGHTIYNGFDKLIENTHKSSPDSLVITYNGTLYESQNIEIFLEGLKLFINVNPDKKITFNMPGILFDQKQANRVMKNMKGYEAHLVMTDRIPKEEVIEIQKISDLLLMVAHSNVKGVTSSKIFEYISLQKPFIVCPNDHDVLEEIALQSGLGKVIDSPNEVAQYLNKIILNYQIEPDLEKLSQFDNMRQVESLSDILLGSDTNIITL